MFGKIQLANFDNVEVKLPQGAASAMSAIEGLELAGANYKVLLYLGEQQVNGTNYYFVALQTRPTNPIVRRVVKIAVNELDGKYELIKKSVEEILS